VNNHLEKNTHLNKLVQVSAPARLHLGFLDLNGSTGRKFGSIGVTISDFETAIDVTTSDVTAIQGDALPSSIVDKTHSIINQFYASIGIDVPVQNQPVSITFKQWIPEHSGLGSGTQLAICIGTALCKLHGIKKSTIEIATALGRGARSGIGIRAFDQGGFIIDSGRNAASEYPVCTVRYDYPEDWHIVLILDPEHQGIHGNSETSAFKELPQFPLSGSQSICHLTLMKLMPALLEQDLINFGDAITQIQALIGDHFSPAQGGRYSSDQVAAMLEHAVKLGHTGIAQSSWGPTGCVFVESQEQASQLVEQLSSVANTMFDKHNRLSFCITKANNSGSNIDIIDRI
jgi:beta-RFAP synthase